MMHHLLKKPIFRDFSILILVTGLLTLVFRYTNLDIALERNFFSPDKGWLLQYKHFWDLIYRFGIFPGYFLAFCGLIMISVSYWNVKYVRFRKASLVLVFSIVVGPGLLINLVLKDHSGRPRPREITEFGGTEQYICVCEKGKTNDGKSFPCGHCSMGFYLAIPYLFYRNRKKALAWTIFAAGTGYGILVGISRMMAGGHFASDVLWAGSLIWAVALAGHYLFRADRPVEIPVLSTLEQKKKARRVTLVIGILLPVITVGLMLATPYFSTKYFFFTRSQLKASNCRVIEADLKDAIVQIGADTCFRIGYTVNAFGFPNSKLRGMWTAGDTCRYAVQYMGWFTEVRNNIKLGIPPGDSISYLVRVNHGKIIFNLPDSCNARFRFIIEKGDLVLYPGKRDIVSYELKDGKVVIEN
jgi:lipid A 4'-phosphatase